MGSQLVKYFYFCNVLIQKLISAASLVRRGDNSRWICIFDFYLEDFPDTTL